MKLLARLLAGLVGLVVLLVGAVYGVSTWRMRQRVSVNEPAPSIPGDSAAIARGAYLVQAIGKCVDCHGADLGGQLFIDGGPLGTIHAPNLTSGVGSVTASRSDADLVHALRHGVGAGGRKLMFMPSSEYAAMADDDVAAVVAYIRQVPPVNRESQPSKIGPLGRALYVAGQLPLFEAEQIDHANTSRRRPPAGVSADYGKYLASIGGCHGCHGPTLSGGRVPGTPPEFKPAANLTPTGLAAYDETAFIRALREAKRPDGTAIDPFMPVSSTKHMTADDIKAVWAYLQTVEPREFGGR